MQDFQRKKKLRKVLYSRNVVIVLSVVAVLLLRGAMGVVGKERLSEKNVVTLREDLAQAQKRNEELGNQSALLSTQAGVEREIRQKFFVTKLGEQVAVIVDPPVQYTASSTKLSVWGNIVSWFLGIFH